MTIIYKNKIKGIGTMADHFLKEKMIILFGNEAPQDLKDFCYVIDVVKAEGVIQAGQKLYINNEKFEITSVGDAVQRNLTTLGHITLRFDGSTTPELPGTLYLENKDIPEIGLNTEIKIASE
ncbi:MAG: PTS sorbitol transporter subunit IIA [Bacillaceae bacterium]|jgi:PTS system glucitol/sorbitol-specific IIA component|uniref:PTS sorbitol transporter subunit IIA n=3 Tax=Aeribacillus TaxID=1055323 RepID=A0A165X215_9BACI|nr:MULTISPECIES: PTS glucitol/sorbitol transporter subunit IIA [Aeribacillus]AXI38202.1 PTS sorbitol transporter subunit IIA [Bacillaceae bacterium ZC4]REJ19988.1 MAG: PTS sorbitol transporter subunit IIA [Bacillaceae bacterium]ASS88931.1 PTS sorbitol transporter subunit IIA [Aeribacillus pallidus]KZN95536.1 PTS sorbitol transporter subunit IIA [Aeribacillus pallidus]MDR9794772.1 PTS glucitol/sorbitol transporter subunit IIA [Aeribacillus pallidus]